MAEEIARGAIYLYRFARPDKRRPVVVLSRQAALSRMRTAVVASITSTVRGLATEVHVGVAEGLKHESAVSLDHLYTVEQSDLVRWIGTVDARRLDQICAAIHVALGC